MQSQSRRALLRAIGYGGVSAAAAPLLITPALANPTTGISPALVALIADCDRTNQASARYNDEVYEPVRLRWLAAKAAVPHIEFDGPGNYDGGPATWSTEQEHRVRHAKWAVRQRVAFWGPGSDDAREAHKAQRKLVAAELRRERAFKRINRQLNFDALYDEGERLDQLFYDAIDAVVDYPVASLADLTAKLDFMAKHDQFENDNTPEVIRRDVSSLQNREA